MSLIFDEIKMDEHFNIITFSSEVNLYSKEMVKMSKEGKTAALEHVSHGVGKFLRCSGFLQAFLRRNE